MLKLQVMDHDARVEIIRQRVAEARINPGQTKTEYKFRNGEPLPIIWLEINTPIYRLENYRTRDKQLTLQARGQVTADFFNPNQRENQSVQNQQHQILEQLSKTGSGETIKPIYEELRRVKRQTDELIISADGVVVNGNRRLAAMRALRATYDAEDKNSDPFDEFANVRCAVLPASATPDEIRSLEIALQMQPETKLPYEWTALGRAVRDLRASGESEDSIMRETNRSKTEIQRAVKMVDAAELYLDKWLGKPLNFDELEGTEQAFIQIATRNYAKQEDLNKREATRKFDFFLVENRQHLGDSQYFLINVIEANPDAFLTAVSAEWDIQLKPKALDAVKQPKFAFDSPEESGELDYQPLTDKLISLRGDETGAAKLVDFIEETCANIAEQGKNRDKAALQFARKADKNLSLIDLQTAAAATHEEIKTLLIRASERIERLLADLS